MNTQMLEDERRMWISTVAGVRAEMEDRHAARQKEIAQTRAQINEMEAKIAWLDGSHEGEHGENRCNSCGSVL